MKKNLNLNEIELLTRDQAKQYCDKYNIEYRSKDETSNLKNKIKKFLNLTSKPANKKVESKASSKKVTDKKSVPTKASKPTTSSTKAKTVTVKKETKTTPAKSKPKVNDTPEIKLRILGHNMLLSVGSDNHTLKVVDATLRNNIKELVSKYTTKPTKTGLKQILDNFTKKDVKVSVSKPIKQVSKEEEKNLQNKVKEEPKPVNRPTTRLNKEY